MFLHERLPAGAPLLPATDTVHSRGSAGRSSASSTDRKCCMSGCICRLFSSSPKLAYKLSTVQEDLDLPRKLHIGPIVRTLQWLYDHRSLLLTISQCLGVLEKLVDCSMLVTVDEYLWRRTPAYGVSSADSSSSIFCQHITLDGSIRRTFQPRAGVNFVLKFD